MNFEPIYVCSQETLDDDHAHVQMVTMLGSTIETLKYFEESI